jgi:CheY-like chemotaxis protein
LARRFLPDIVLCDIGLPGMDGYAVARAIRAEPSLAAVRLVALTGYALPDDIQKATDAGFDQHLAKPASAESLDRILSQGEKRAS